MTFESKLSSKSSRKPNTRQNQKTKEIYKINMSSDDDDNDFISEDEEENDMDLKSYRNFLSDLFPSKYMKEKADNTVSSKLNDKKTPKKLIPTQSQMLLPPSAPKKSTQVKAKPASASAKPESAKAKPASDKQAKCAKAMPVKAMPVKAKPVSPKPALESSNKKELTPKNPKRKLEYKEEELKTDEDDESYETIDETEEDTEEEDTEQEEIDLYDSKIIQGGKKGQPAKFNIVFNVGSLGDFDDYDDEYDEDYDIDEDEDSDYDEDTEDETEDEEENISLTVSEKNENSFTNEEAFTSFNNMIEGLTDVQRQNPVVKEMIADIKAKEVAHKIENEHKQKKQKGKNTRKFKSLLREKNVMNDVKFFKENMTQEQQRIVLKQMEEIKKFSDVEKPYRLQLLEANIPVAFKACAYKKINTLKYMEPGAGEYYKIKNWVDTFMQIPFGKR